MSWRPARLLAAFAFTLFLWAGVGFAYDAAIIGEAQRAIEEFRNALAKIENELQLPAITDPQLTEYRGNLEDIRAKALSKSAGFAQPIAEVRQQIELLGPLPAEGAAEAPAVASQRAELTAQQNLLLGIQSQLELVSVSAEQLAGRASSLQRNLFVTRIFEGGRTIFRPSLWLDTGRGLGLLVERLGSLYSNWWVQVGTTANISSLALIPALLTIFAGLYYLARGRLRRWINTNLVANTSPDEIERLWRIVRAVIAVFVLLAVLVLLIYAALSIGGFVTPRFDMILGAAVDALIVTVLYAMLARRVAAPGQPQWRIVDLDDAAAARLPVLVTLAGFVSAATNSLGAIADGLYLPVSYTVGQSALSAIAMLLLLALILLTVRNQQGLPDKRPDRRLYFKWASAFVPLLWLLIAIGVIALLAGYVALASYLALQIFETSVLVTVLFLLHHLADAAVTSSFDPQSSFGRLLRKLTGLGERGIERLGLLFRIIVDIILLVAGLPLLFVLWTFTWVDFRSLANTALFGFKVGDITLSPWSVIVVLLVLAFGIVLTNLLVRWLDRRILAETRVDKGVQDSLRKGASYTGYFIAALMAFTAAGLDFTNFAFLAGALGIGIGFGLQSIVNNFVSGLILLAERPVRVGDWVSLASGEGIVKRINVRSTEIETFDSCVIIVPNSNLITEPVKNWTHGDTMGRFTVAVTVAYGSDAEQVRDQLLAVARSHPKVLTYPEPQVTLVRFGINGLDFEIKANVADVFEAHFVASDLRYAILKTFAEKAITIPLPPRLIQPSNG